MGVVDDEKAELDCSRSHPEQTGFGRFKLVPRGRLRDLGGDIGWSVWRAYHRTQPIATRRDLTCTSRNTARARRAYGTWNPLNHASHRHLPTPPRAHTHPTPCSKRHKPTPQSLGSSAIIISSCTLILHMGMSNGIICPSCNHAHMLPPCPTTAFPHHQIGCPDRPRSQTNHAPPMGGQDASPPALPPPLPTWRACPIRTPAFHLWQRRPHMCGGCRQKERAGGRGS